jgi:hypothetical protein
MADRGPGLVFGRGCALRRIATSNLRVLRDPNRWGCSIWGATTRQPALMVSKHRIVEQLRLDSTVGCKGELQPRRGRDYG